jgi:hypothetical protein
MRFCRLSRLQQLDIFGTAATAGVESGGPAHRRHEAEENGRRPDQTYGHQRGDVAAAAAAGTHTEPLLPV